MNALVGVLMVLVAHGHYTIDVLIAYYITTRLFWVYHTLANNCFLLKVNLLLIFGSIVSSQFYFLDAPKEYVLHPVICKDL